MNRGQHGRGPHGHRGGGGWEGGRIPKGKVRGLLLAALLDGPAHGYELMRRLEAQAGGRWRPSPGSVYPLLQQLEDEDLVRGDETEGRRIFELTDQGRQQADQGRLADLAEGASSASAHLDLRAEVHRLHAAARQLGTTGAPEQLTEALEIVRTARQALYRLLAE